MSEETVPQTVNPDAAAQPQPEPAVELPGFKPVRIYNGGTFLIQLGFVPHETNPSMLRPATVFVFQKHTRPGWPENAVTFPDLVFLRELIDAAIRDQVNLVRIDTGARQESEKT